MVEPMVDLKGRVAVVTGGTKGIGRAIAEALLDAGASIAFGARTGPDVEAAEDAMRERARAARREGRTDQNVLGVQCDVRSRTDCERLIAAAVASLGQIDILVNNAGVGHYAPVADLAPEDWDDVISTNLDGVFYCTHAALPHLMEAGDSWIINIGSLAGKNAFPGGAAYNASKFGLIGFSEALMQEVRHDGVRVSYIMPGSVASTFSGRQRGVDDDWKIQPEDVAALVLDLLSMPARTLPSRIEVRPSRPPRK